MIPRYFITEPYWVSVTLYELLLSRVVFPLSIMVVSMAKVASIIVPNMLGTYYCCRDCEDGERILSIRVGTPDSSILSSKSTVSLTPFRHPFKQLLIL